MIAEYYDEEMNLIHTDDLITTNLDIPSTNFMNKWVYGDRAPVFTGAYAEQKKITATIELVAHDYFDYTLLRDKLYGIFGFNTPFYVVDKRQPGKRHKVVLDANFTPTRHNAVNGTAVIPFTTIQPYAESIGTTQDIQQNVSTDDELWAHGMGLIADDLIYSPTVVASQPFSIYNAGIAIHPFEQELKITIVPDEPSENLTLTNNTTGNTFQVNRSLNPQVNITLDGPAITLNGLQILRDTNKEFIELAPEWNEFTLSVNATIHFDFRFYYN